MIYFDNAATAPLCDASKMILTKDFGNPSSPHALGLDAERKLKEAAKDLAEILSCHSEEVIFTSGGTESNNLGILGAAFALKSERGRNRNMHILASNQEHPSVTKPLAYLASLPGYKVSYAAPSDWEAYINEDTALICANQVDSETGCVLRIKDISDAVLFIDGAQGFCKTAPTIKADIYTFSGHKFHGPMGVGGMYIRKGIRLQPLIYGGGQQKGIRPGTENVPGILAMLAAAKEQWQNRVENHSKMLRIKNILASMVDEMPESEIYINQIDEFSSPYILNMSFVGVRGETLTSLLSSKGIYVSMGTACRAKKESALVGMGFSRERAESAVRLSFSAMNTEEEAYQAKEIIKDSVKQLKKITGNKRKGRK